MEGKFISLQKVLNIIDVGIVLVDADNKIIFFNRAAGKMLNVDPEERIGTSILLCHPKVFEQKVEQYIDEFRKNPRLKQIGGFVNFQGKYLRETFYGISDEQGNYLGLIDEIQYVEEIVSLLKQLGKFEEPHVSGVGEMRPRKP